MIVGKIIAEQVSYSNAMIDVKGELHKIIVGTDAGNMMDTEKDQLKNLDKQVVK